MKTNLLIIVMLFFVTGLFAQDVNLLDTLNGSFEKGDGSDWRFIEITSDGGVVDDLSTLEIQTDEVIDGTYAARWTQKFSSTHIEMVFDKWHPMSALCQPDADYTIKLDAYMESGYGTLVVCMGFFDKDGGFMQDTKDFTLKNPGDKDAFPPEWTHFEYTIHSPNNAASLYIGFRIYNQKSTDDWLDGINPEATDGDRWPTEDESPVVVDIDKVEIWGQAGTPTAIKPNIAEIGIKAFPNPASDIIRIEADSKINNISICNIAGKIVKSINTKSANSANIILSDLKPGIYFIKINSQNGSAVTKILKQ